MESNNVKRIKNGFSILIVFILFAINVNAQNQHCKCCSQNHLAFDFWIGKRTVTGPEEKIVGHSIVEKIQDSCVLKENCTSAKGGYTGTSLNFYNTTTQQWEQIWLDNQGGSLHLKGSRVGNQMILKTEEIKNDNGESYYHKITWTKNDDGSVRQYWKTITKGKGIKVAFDGLYKKRE